MPQRGTWEGLPAEGTGLPVTQPKRSRVGADRLAE